MVAQDTQGVAPKLRDSPLLYVLMIVDISPVMAIESYIPKLQDALRLQGFPGFEKSQVTELTFSSQGMTTSEITQWHFADPARTTSILMSQTKIGFETTAYDTFERFCQVFEIGISVALQELGGSLVAQRLGLRYVNALQPYMGEEFGTVLKEQLVGFDENFAGVTNTNFQIFFQGTTPEGTLSVRVIQPPHRADQPNAALLLPPDLTTDLKIPLKFDLERKYRLLDLDHATRTEMALDTKTLLPLLTGLHARIETAFLEAVNQNAYARWAGASQATTY